MRGEGITVYTSNRTCSLAVMSCRGVLPRQTGNSYREVTGACVYGWLGCPRSSKSSSPGKVPAGAMTDAGSPEARLLMV